MTAELIKALSDPAVYPHPVDRIEVFETHISWVILTGQFAYKLKKPVKYDFVDFSTLKLRRQLCEAELRLNRQFAPQLYLQVVPLYGTPATPSFEVNGEPFEYAVQMRQFATRDRLDRVLERGELTYDHVDQLVDCIATAHAEAKAAEAESAYGEPGRIAERVRLTIDAAFQNLTDPAIRARLHSVLEWTTAEAGRLHDVLASRKQSGFVRECHGDLHLENIVLYEGVPLPFDCLEFNPELRWIDVLSDVAFLTMDLTQRGAATLSHRVRNRYLELTGDYGGLNVVRFYQCYRALVRCAVTALRAQSIDDVTDRKNVQLEAIDYLSLAEQFTQSPVPALILTHGLSASGKSTFTEPLLERLGAIRLRSDVERRRMPFMGNNDDRYSQAARDAVYDRLLALAESSLRAGSTTIVDATFLRRSHRDQFRDLAARLKVPCTLISFQRSLAELNRRIEARSAHGIDPSEATSEVLQSQLGELEPLGSDEGFIDGSGPVETALDQVIRLVEKR